MITIGQLLESVDLSFEPRWITKDSNSTISIFAERPERRCTVWDSCKKMQVFGKIKLAEFDGKDWTECIYKVPRKVDPKQELDEMIDKGISGLFYKKYGCWSCDFYPFCNNNVPEKPQQKP